MTPGLIRERHILNLTVDGTLPNMGQRSIGEKARMWMA